MMRSPSVLTFAGFYLPGYKAGGPIQSVANMVAHLGAQFDFRIITRDRDSGDVSPYPGIIPGQWQNVGMAQVCYLAQAEQTLRTLTALLRETPYDLIYLNSFFHWRLSVLPLLARKLGWMPRRPVILAPRGEFSRGALGLKSGRKRAFLVASRILGLHRGIIWHASSEHEARDIRTIFGADLQIHVASDLPRAVQSGLLHEPRASGGAVRVVFLSRIARMKNLNFVLEVLKRVTVPVNLSIVGFIDDAAYWNECQSLIEKLPPQIKVSYHGMVPAEQVPAVIAKSDVFFLPTLGENFGHVIIEALGAGTPALISDRTPWRDLDDAGCGWILPLGDAQLFAERIDSLFNETPEISEGRRRAAINYARRFADDSGVVDANRRLFLRAIQRG